METEQIAQPLSWIKRIPGNLISLDEKPLLGSPPPFPYDELATLIASAFQIKNVRFEGKEWQWRAQEQLFDGYGDKLKITALNMAPVEGGLWWVMSQADFTRMMTIVLGIDGVDAMDNDISEALSAFFTMQFLDTFGKCNFDKKLSLQILSAPTTPASPCLSLDISTTIGDATFPSRLLLSPEFRHNWKERYTDKEKKLMLESPLADSLEVVVHLEAGRLNIAKNEWNQLQQGDFVVLESCSLDPSEDKGRVMLTINGMPYFRAKLKQGSLKILEYPLYYEVPSMNAPKGEESKKDEGEDFDEDFDDLDADLDDEKKEAAPAKPEAKTEKKKEASEDIDEDFDIEDELSTEEFDTELSEEKSEDEKKEEKPSGIKKVQESAPAESAGQKKPTPLEDIPLCVVLEVGRIQMSVKKLLELQPGNMLELDIHPEDGVDMVVNGRKVARGELLKIGDAIGVRISERL